MHLKNFRSQEKGVAIVATLLVLTAITAVVTATHLITDARRSNVQSDQRKKVVMDTTLSLFYEMFSAVQNGIISTDIPLGQWKNYDGGSLVNNFPDLSTFSYEGFTARAGIENNDLDSGKLFAKITISDVASGFTGYAEIFLGTIANIGAAPEVEDPIYGGKCLMQIGITCNPLSAACENWRFSATNPSDFPKKIDSRIHHGAYVFDATRSYDFNTTIRKGGASVRAFCAYGSHSNPHDDAYSSNGTASPIAEPFPYAGDPAITKTTYTNARISGKTLSTSQIITSGQEPYIIKEDDTARGASRILEQSQIRKLFQAAKSLSDPTASCNMTDTTGMLFDSWGLGGKKWPNPQSSPAFSETKILYFSGTNTIDDEHTGRYPTWNSASGKSIFMFFDDNSVTTLNICLAGMGTMILRGNAKVIFNKPTAGTCEYGTEQKFAGYIHMYKTRDVADVEPAIVAAGLDLYLAYTDTNRNYMNLGSLKYFWKQVALNLQCNGTTAGEDPNQVWTFNIVQLGVSGT